MLHHVVDENPQVVRAGRLGAPRSVRGKMMRIVVITTAIALLAAGTGMLAHDLSVYRDSWVADLDTQSRILATSSSSAQTSGDRAIADRKGGAGGGGPGGRGAAGDGAD